MRAKSIAHDISACVQDMQGEYLNQQYVIK